MLVPLEVHVFVAVDERERWRCYLRPRFVIDATEKSKGGVAAEMSSFQTGLRTESKGNILFLPRLTHIEPNCRFGGKLTWN